jgi:hypothetical protein
MAPAPCSACRLRLTVTNVNTMGAAVGSIMATIMVAHMATARARSAAVQASERAMPMAAMSAVCPLSRIV